MTYDLNPSRTPYGVSFGFSGAFPPPPMENLGPPAQDAPVAPSPTDLAPDMPEDSALAGHLPTSPPSPDGAVPHSEPPSPLIEEEQGSETGAAAGTRLPVGQDWGSDPTQKMCACAVSGSLLAVVTLVPGKWSWRVFQAATRKFHLQGRNQDDRRKLAGEIREFMVGEGLTEIAFCRTATGSWTDGLDDEVRIESIMMLCPFLVNLVSNDTVAEWIIAQNPPAPENMPPGRLGFAETRALELAQYVVAHRHDI